MNRVEFSELLRLSMGVESQDRRASMDDRVLWRLGDVVRGKLIFDYAQSTQTKGEFVRGIVIDVENDAIRNRRFVDISASILNMPNNYGFASISLVQDDNNPITITSVGQIGIAEGLECSDIGITGWQEGGRIYFENLNPETEQMLVIGIPSIASLTNEEEIPIPYSLEDVWLDKVKAKLLPMQPEDVTNSDTRTNKV